MALYFLFYGNKYTGTYFLQVAGMLVYFILSGGKHPFGEGRLRQFNISNGDFQLKDLIDEEAKDMIESMLSDDPTERPRITEVLSHPYFWDEDRYII